MGTEQTKKRKSKINKIARSENPFYKFLQRVCITFWFIASFPWFAIMQPTKVFYKKRFIKKRRIIHVANHLNYLDPIMIIHKFFPTFNMYALGKKELASTPIVLFGWMINLIYIERGAADIESMKMCMHALKHNNELLIYPEGTRNKMGNTEIQEIKDGVAIFAHKCESPLQPVINSGKYTPFKKNYMYVGREFDISEFYDRRLTPDVTAGIKAKIYAKMNEARSEMLVEIDLWENRRKYKKLYKAALVSGDFTGISEEFVKRQKTAH